jgi:hypothetical protein
LIQQLLLNSTAPSLNHTYSYTYTYIEKADFSATGFRGMAVYVWESESVLNGNGRVTRVH